MMIHCVYATELSKKSLKICAKGAEPGDSVVLFEGDRMQCEEFAFLKSQEEPLGVITFPVNYPLFDTDGEQVGWSGDWHGGRTPGFFPDLLDRGTDTLLREAGVPTQILAGGITRENMREATARVVPGAGEFTIDGRRVSGEEFEKLRKFYSCPPTRIYEIPDEPVADEAVIRDIMKDAKPIPSFIGTPKSEENPLQRMWDTSSYVLDVAIYFSGPGDEPEREPPDEHLQYAYGHGDDA